MSQAIQLKIEVPGDLARFRLPKGVEKRLHALLDKQDQGHPLSTAERREAEGLVDLVDLFSWLRLKSQRIRPKRA